LFTVLVRGLRESDGHRDVVKKRDNNVNKKAVISQRFPRDAQSDNTHLV